MAYVPEFENLDQLLTYVESSFVIDLDGLCEITLNPDVREVIAPAVAGIYSISNGRLLLAFNEKEPLFDTAQFAELNRGLALPSMYALRSMTAAQRRYFENLRPRLPAPVRTLQQVLAAEAGLCNRRGAQVTATEFFRRNIRRITDVPQDTEMRLGFTKAMVARIVQRECAKARTGCLGTLSSFVKPQYLGAVSDGFFDDLYGRFRTALLKFVGDDVLHIYTLGQKNDNLLLFKKMDYRIYAYYEGRFSLSDPDD